MAVTHSGSEYVTNDAKCVTGAPGWCDAFERDGAFVTELSAMRHRQFPRLRNALACVCDAMTYFSINFTQGIEKMTLSIRGGYARARSATASSSAGSPYVVGQSA